MGELLFCHEPIAALPYYVEGAGINLYSMEELCYYIAGNTYLLDESFMSEELCTWVEHQMGLFALAAQLRDIRSLSQFVQTILVQTGYHTPKETEEIVLTVRQMEEKTDFECRKLRADRLMENGKYIGSIHEYRRLLNTEEAKHAGPVVGAIWHNLGTAHARLFLFQEAAGCYDIAYSLAHSKDSLKCSLMCHLCLHDEKGFAEKVRAHHLDETEAEEYKKAFAAAENDENMRAFSGRLEQIKKLEDEGEKAQAKQAVREMIFQWKEDYRKSCRM